MIGFFDKVFTVYKTKFSDKRPSKQFVKRIINDDQVETENLSDCQPEDINSLFHYYFDVDIDEDEPEENFIFI